ncbi:MAG: flagellar basal body rod protein FlgC [Alphaproteobacteria bacterium]|nr:flagellar basal body rod protein FlgC [Alphaproteobacteria bacterium]
MDLSAVLRISAAGMDAQGTRMRTIAENMANADALPTSPEQDPYRRKTVAFRNVLDRASGVQMVRADRILKDKSDPRLKYDPTHPAADERGYVKTPNINTLVEVMDMRQAQRTYDANLGVIEIAKSMITRTIDILRG